MSGEAENPGVPAPEEDSRKKACDDEFAQYYTERAALTKSELEAEKNYDTLLVTLSTLAIGSSFTILKDFVKAASAGETALIVLAWAFLSLCLIIALVDRLMTFWTHKRWREEFDAEFHDWRGPGAFTRAAERYQKIWGIRVLPWLKWVGFASLLLGVLFLMAFVLAGIGSARSETKSASPVIVNVYSTAPATAPAGSPATAPSQAHNP